MDRWIEHLVEPPRLILEWRPPTHVTDRSRWAVGELWRTENGAEFRYFDAQQLTTLNNARTPEVLRAAGFVGYPAFPWDPRRPGGVFRERALEPFLRRLPSPRRSDFAAYLDRFFLRPGTPMSAFALLATTGASLPNDGFSLVDPLDGEATLQDVALEVNGVRHHWQHLSAPPAVGSRVSLVPEPTMPHDHFAVRVEVEGAVIGYVSRLQSPAVSRWIARGVAGAWLVRVNGTAAEPRAHILAQVRDRAMRPAA
jgi:hypothetical protein